MKKLFFASVRTGMVLSIAILLLATTQKASFFERMFSKFHHQVYQSHSAILSSPGATCNSLASDAIGGNVWEDFNYDGDRSTESTIYGVAGIEVSLFNTKNEKVATELTDVHGNYLFENLTATDYRLEFIIPNDKKAFTKGTFLGTDSKTSVQLVSAGTCANFGVANPAQYCDSNPYLITPCFVSGEPSLGGSAAKGDVLVSYPHAAGGTKADVNMLALNEDIGTTWGIAYAKTNQDIFAAAMFKRHAGFGALGISGIYRINHTDPSNPVIEQWMDLALEGVNVGSNPRNYQLPASSTGSSTDSVAFDAVGKIGLGDLDISEDEKTLYAINLNNNGSLVEIDIATKTVTKTTPIANPSTGNPSDVRPWGLSVYQGNVYVGSVYSGQIGGGASMRFFVQKYDGTSFTTVLNESLNYEKGFVHLRYNRPAAPEICKNWETWTSDFNNIHAADSVSQRPRWCRPQPILSDIEFDRDGSMILAFMDRTGHQTGYLQANTDEQHRILGNGYVGGDILRVANQNGTFILENGGTTVNGGGAGLNNQAGATNQDTVLQGPGGGEYYSGEFFRDFHQETSLGGIVLSPDGETVALNVMDPTNFFTGGTIWLNNTTGTADRVFELYSSNHIISPNGTNNEGTFGKAAGLGDLELSCAPAPIEIGNYVWNDANSDGIQDANETGIDGLTVELIKNGVKIATTTTTNGGQYYFSGDGAANQTWMTSGNRLLPNMEYCVQILLNESALGSKIPTSADADNTANGDARDNDAQPAGNYAKITFTTGGAGETNHNLDFGFTSNICIGDYVWLDKNVDGVQDADEQGIDGITVELVKNNVVVATSVTQNGGKYLFTIDGTANQTWTTSGDQVLPNMNYTVRIALNQNGLDKLKVTTKKQTTDDLDSDADLASNYAIINLTSGTAGSSDHHYDFGFRPTMCVGNLVWADDNNNGLFDGSEKGVDNVEVKLINVGSDGQKNTSDDVETATTTTTNGGKYLFSDLDAGTYFVKLNSGLPADYGSSTGAGNTFVNPTTYEPGSTSNADNDDNGTQMGSMIMSAAFTLDYCQAPTNEDGDNNTDLTIDFGLTSCLALGDYVWLDKNADGIQDTSEQGINGVTVELVKDNAVVATTTTQNGGQYLFSGDGTAGQTWTTSGDKLRPNMAYTIRIAVGQNPLIKYKLTGQNKTQDELDSDGAMDNQYAIIQLTSSTAGSFEKHYDFGFRPCLSVGNQVWADANNNGLLDSGENGVDGIEVVLINVGMDGQKNTADDSETAATTTKNGGAYLFEDVAEGTYFIKLNDLPAGYRSATGAGLDFSNPASFEPGDATDTDNNDNGTQMGSMIMSGVFELAYCQAPTSEDGDDNTNLTIDFGLTKCSTLGDYVWLDKNADGIQDNDEAGIDGITVELVKNNVVVATTTTQNGGLYLFSEAGATNQNWTNTDDKLLPSMDYVVRIPLSQTILEKYKLTEPNQTNDQKDADATVSGDYAIINLTSDVLGTDDLKYDFGFRPSLSVGNQVWTDANNNGLFDGGENGVDGIEVVLFNIGSDGQKNTADDSATAKTTTQNGGQYSFEDVAEGSYYIKLNDGIPAGYMSATGAGLDFANPANFEPGDATDADNNDNGTQMGSMIMSAVFKLEYCKAPTSEDGDDNTNLTIDFGLTKCSTLGDYVWLDKNADGIQDSNESGLDGITVELVKDNVVVATTTTQNGGQYLFSADGAAQQNWATSGDKLLPKMEYVVRIPLNQPSLTKHKLSAANQTNDNDDSDATTSSNYAVINLTSDLLGTDERQYDFGFRPTLCVGNLVWLDQNNNGLAEPTEKGIEGVEVILFHAGTDGIKGNGDDAEITRQRTDAQGKYLFSDLDEGVYFIKINEGIPANLASANGAGKDGTQDSAYEPGKATSTDIDNDDNGTQMGNMVMTDTFTLAYCAEPTTDGDNDNNTNLSVDIGLTPCLSVGNLIFHDLNNSGTADANDPTLGGIEVQLYTTGADGQKSADDVLVSAMTTLDDGLYRFDNLKPGNYYIKLNDGIPPNMISATGEGFANVTGQGANEPAPSPDTNSADNDDNGTQMGSMIMSEIFNLAIDGEPTNDGDNDPNTNLTVDFGLIELMSLGNLVWKDVNNNGLVDDTEKGVAGVETILFQLGPDGQRLTADDVEVKRDTTDTNGHYLFTQLTPGDYYVKLADGIPLGCGSSTGEGIMDVDGIGDYEPAPNPNTDLNNDDNGHQYDYKIVSEVVTLALNTEPTNDDDADDQSNLTVDFGLFQLLRLGNVVWEDFDNDGYHDAGEPGISDVETILYQVGPDGIKGNEDDVEIDRMVTDAAGHYIFVRLLPGDYYVKLNSGIENYSSSTGEGIDQVTGNGNFEVAPDPDNDIDEEDNGTQMGNMVMSDLITLEFMGEPITEDNFINSNFTLDFGLFQPLALGNLVWEDQNNNGRVDAGEPGFSGITVQLFNVGTDGQKNEDDILVDQTVTDVNGGYNFTNLKPGNYYVKLSNIPTNYISSTGAGLENLGGTGPFEPAPSPNNDLNGDDNGSQMGNMVMSDVVTLQLYNEPITDGDTDRKTNLAVDFGLLKVNQIKIHNPCTCLNNESSIGAGDGQFAEQVVILSSFSGQTWAVMAAEGAYNSANGRIVPGAVAVEAGTEDGYYRYVFDVRHDDGKGYAIKFSNGTDNLSVSNLCRYEQSCKLSPPPVCDDCTPGPPQPDPCLMTFIMGTDNVPRVDSLNCCDNKSTFLDDGLNDGLYEDSLGIPRNDIFTICPQNQWQQLIFNFSEFNVAAGDTLYVYDGRTVTDSLLGKFSGTGVSATGGWVGSTCSPAKNASSCLTFRFVTNGDNNKGTGWNGNFECKERDIELTPPNIASPKLACDETIGRVTIRPATVTAACGTVQDSQRVIISVGNNICKDTCLAPNETVTLPFAIGTYKVTYALKSDPVKTTEAVFGVQAATHVCNDLVRIPLGAGCELQIVPDDLLEGPCDTIADTAYYFITIRGIGKDNQETVIAQGGGKDGHYPIVTKAQFEEFGGQLVADIERRFYEGLTLDVCNNGVQSLTCRTKIEIADNTGPIFQAASTRDTFKVCDVELTEQGLSFLEAPKAIDACTDVSIQFSSITVIDDGGVCDTTRIDVHWTATDENGNSSIFTKNVVLFRADTSDLLLPENVNLSCGEDTEASFDDLTKTGIPSLQIGQIKNGILAPFDTIELSTEKYICGYILKQLDQKIDAGNCGTKLFRKWELLDWCAAGNGIFPLPTQLINLKDTLAPTFTANVDTLPFANLDLDHRSCTFDLAQLAKPAATDQCSEAVVKIDRVWRIEDNRPWDVPMGQWSSLDCDSFLISWVAEDACHEQLKGDTIYQNVLIRDVTKPSTVCTDKITVSLGNSAIRMNASAFDAGSFDACGIATLKVSRDATNWGDFVEFDCQDVHRAIKVYLRATDQKGNQSTCWSTVTVEDKLAPICSNLPDQTGTCDAQKAEVFGPSTDTNGDGKMSDDEWTDMTETQVNYYNTQYGDPKCSDNADACGALVMEQQYQLIEWPCGMLEIKRRYRAIDWMGEGNKSAYVEQNIKIEYKANWSLTLPADWAGSCGADIPHSEAFVTNGKCDLLAIEVDEKTFVANEDACLKVLRTFTIINWCNYQAGDEGITLPRDESAHGMVQFPVIVTSKGLEDVGKMTYTQVLKLKDNEAPKVTIQSPDTCISGIDGDAAPYGAPDLVLGAAPYECDEPKTWTATAEDCAGAENITWKAQLYENGILVAESTTNRITYVVQPKNTYKAEFWAYDGCGNSGGAETEDQVFTDCKKPTPYCLHGLATELMPSGMIQVWAKDIDRGSFDNCTAANKLDTRIYHAALGSAPTDLASVQALPQQVTLNCVYLGTQTVRLYVIDEAGNWDFCETYVIIQDNMGACGDREPQAGLSRVEGTIEDWQGNTVENVIVHINNNNKVTTEVDGQYRFDLASNEGYTITPEKDIDPLNGVSTFDLVLMSQHILGIQRFQTPYQYLAADVNQSGSITAFDMVQLRQLILNVRTAFTNNTSWKFVVADYEFISDNPAAEDYPTVAKIDDITQPMQIDFTAIKIGDVNGNATANGLATTESRSTMEAFRIKVADQIVKAGQTYQVDFTTDELATIEGYQFTLDMGELQFEKLTNGITRIDNFGLHKVKEGQLTTSWNAVGSEQLAVGSEQLFRLELTATRDGLLSDQLQIIDRPTAVEAYDRNGDIRTIQLEFTPLTSDTPTLKLYQNQPNPFKETTTISFYLPDNSPVILTLRDDMGRLLQTIKTNKTAGLQTISIHQADLPKGLIYYQLQTDFGTQTRKMLHLE
ncbi:MAG: SdrD B-like domain-containing protein [Bacteroidota bacterium]